MSKTYTQINPATDTFSGWLAKQNSILADMSSIIITTNNDGSSGVTTGNAHVNGIVSATTLRANTISGGNTINGDNLIIVSNTTFSGAVTTFVNPIVGSITGNSNTASRFLNPVVINLGGDLTGNTTFSGNNSVTIIANTSANTNILTKSGNLSGIANTSLGRSNLGLGDAAIRSVATSVDFNTSPDFLAPRTTILTVITNMISTLLRPLTLNLGGDLTGNIGLSANNTSPILVTAANPSGNILTKSGNLSDVGNVVIVRSNLGLSISTDSNFDTAQSSIPTRGTILNYIGKGEVPGVAVAGPGRASILVPTGVNNITVFFNNIIESGNVSDRMGIRLGTVFGIEATGYEGSFQTLDVQAQNGGNFATEFRIWTSGALNGMMHLERIPGNNIWMCSYNVSRASSNSMISLGAGRKQLVGELTEIQLLTLTGAATFTGGSFHIRWRR